MSDLVMILHAVGDLYRQDVVDLAGNQRRAWLTPTVRYIFDVILPLSLLIVTLIYDLITFIAWPKGVRTVWGILSSPFRNFLTIRDIDDSDVERLEASSWKGRILAALALAQLLVDSLWILLEKLMRGQTLSTYSMATVSVWAVIAVRVVVKPPTTPPYLLLLLCITQLLASLLEIVDTLLKEEDMPYGYLALTSVRMILTTLFVWLAGTYPLQAVLPGVTVAHTHDEPSSDLTSPEDRVDLWSWSTFSFVEPIFDAAKRGMLQDTDVWSLPPFFKHRNLFNKYLLYINKHPTHSLLHFLLASNSLDLFLDVALELYRAFADFIPPYALQQILASLTSPTPSSKQTAYTWALVTFVVNLSFAQVDLWKGWHTRRAYERTRGQLFCALHYKALKRRDTEGGPTEGEKGSGTADLGKVVNLMQGDAYAVSQRFWEFSGLFASPIRLVIALLFLYRVLNWSSLFGVAVVLAAYVLNYPLAKYKITVTRGSWTAKDRRMSIVNEFFQNIRFLKFYGWENNWAQKANEAREAELRWRIKSNILDTFMSFIWNIIPSATALSSFLCYTLIAGERLTVSKAFTSMALFGTLQASMTALPAQFFAMLQAYVSMQRIERFLLEEEVPDWASSLKRPSSQTEGSEIGFTSASFIWASVGTGSGSAAPARFTLGPLDIRIPKGRVSIVSGATGSGKSALLAALLGEMQCISGAVHLDKDGHQVAYCAQSPWLEHATIRDNIIYGSKYGFDKERYNAVIYACALLRDLEILEAGDLTEIGERGITLSGGQRARVALARALYSEASCILLDDCLAAVDMHTAQHLVNEALGKFAEGRTVILVTHHVRLCLPVAAYVVELGHGKVLRQGSPNALQELGQLQDVVDAEDEVPREDTASVLDASSEADQDELKKDHEPKKDGLTNGKLIEVEARAEGRISIRTYLTYIWAAGLLSWFLTILLMLLMRAASIGSQFFLAKWGEAYEVSDSDDWLLRRLPPPAENVRPWLFVFLAISLVNALFVLAYIGLGYYASLQASRSLFVAMLARLTRAPARFFDVTPIGRLLNRFVSDMNVVDGALANSARAALLGTLNFLASFSVIVWVVPSFIPLAVFIAFLYVRLAPSYVQASRDLRRLESVSLSPAFAGFDELLRGLPHIRAFAMEQRYQDGFYKKVDNFQTFDHVYWLVSRWLQWRYDCLGSAVVFLTSLFALWTGASSGYAALVIVQAGEFAEASRQLVRVLAQLELDFNSVERIVEYLDVPQEKPAIIADYRPPAYWPSNRGGIVIEGLVVRYASNLPAVLHNLSFTINPSEKVGVVGRTGSGKSTLALTLLRMVEPSDGRILVDSVDICAIGLEDLRKRITIVSQDVSLFSGTIRSNLDPFDEHTDQECWDVLEHCHLRPLLQRTTQEAEGTLLTLDMPISQNSLSAGEKQLLALARAVLRRTTIVIMDEATAQVDHDLDEKIQRTIREELSHALILTIAHRLKTIIDYDRIMVLGQGQILEFDTPRALLMKPDGIFGEMCRRSADWPILRAMHEGVT